MDDLARILQLAGVNSLYEIDVEEAQKRDEIDEAYGDHIDRAHGWKRALQQISMMAQSGAEASAMGKVADEALKDNM